MNRTVRNVALGAAAIALLSLATGAKAQEDAKEEGGGGYGKAPPSPPPEDARTTPKTPGTGKAPKQKPAGNNILPTAPGRPSTDPALAGDLNVASLTWPNTPTREIMDRAIEEYEQGVLVLYVPHSAEQAGDNQALLEMELLIEDWAFLYGYETVAIIYGVPTDRAYTAQVWYQGNERGAYDLETSYTPDYLQALPASALAEAFAAGLIEWLHGPQ